jgi:cysteinyl-tRNA synthetase
MSLELLGEGFDLHCGGADLRFPHHENERAQAVALGKEFARHWMHNGFVVDAEGEKMSKSLGNVANLLDLLDLYDPRAYRMLLLQTHYRSPVRVGQDNIDASVKALSNLDGFYARTADCGSGEIDNDVVSSFRTAMDNDLDTPSAMAVIFDAVRSANAAFDSGDLSRCASFRHTVSEIAGALGLFLRDTSAVDEEIHELARALDEARASKNFAEADAIRNQLQSDGYIVETTKEGTRVRRG